MSAPATAPGQSPAPHDPDSRAYVAQASRLLDMQLDEARIAAVAAAFATYRAAGTLLMEFALPDETEPAPVYVLPEM